MYIGFTDISVSWLETVLRIMTEKSFLVSVNILVVGEFFEKISDHSINPFNISIAFRMVYRVFAFSDT